MVRCRRTHQPQDTVTFPDVTVIFTPEEWTCLDASPRKLYKDVILENYQHLWAIGHSGVKPAVISWLEGGTLRPDRRAMHAELKACLQDFGTQSPSMSEPDREWPEENSEYDA
ncbi:zinc finger protein 426-like [Sorex fumeus]|uniref:zinc finger protein 426-like n=1 Tax=Sorex fumeus TaxID=62283 RepID=UPI0024AD351B|nr:zinc finger protein 426-like [Sorex fumeus]